MDIKCKGIFQIQTSYSPRPCASLLNITTGSKHQFLSQRKSFASSNKILYCRSHQHIPMQPSWRCNLICSLMQFRRWEYATVLWVFIAVTLCRASRQHHNAFVDYSPPATFQSTEWHRVKIESSLIGFVNRVSAQRTLSWESSSHNLLCFRGFHRVKGMRTKFVDGA